jgi:RND family efflux transporter MFP subunit
MNRLIRYALLLLVILLAVAAGWKYYGQTANDNAGGKKKNGDKTVPVNVAEVGQRDMQLIRRFTGTLKPRAEFIVAPKIAGRIKAIHVELADRVERGMVVAEIDDAELRQTVAQAEAELLVAQANHSEAVKLQSIAERELERITKLRKTGVSSEAQIDAASAEQLIKAGLVNVTRAKITKAEAELEAARIQLQEARVLADWHDGSEQRHVAERFIDEGQTVSANTPLLKIVEIDPVVAVFHVTETDYASLSVGQSVRLGTDAFRGEEFTGVIERISPVFSEDTRQASVEIGVANHDLRLKPGMFVRADVIMQSAEQVAVIPERALYRRDESLGVFLLEPDTDEVKWIQLETGIEQDGFVQVIKPALAGRVVTLGQQMLKAGSTVRVVE